jgi:hypothetical protein
LHSNDTIFVVQVKCCHPEARRRGGTSLKLDKRSRGPSLPLGMTPLRMSQHYCKSRARTTRFAAGIITNMFL